MISLAQINKSAESTRTILIRIVLFYILEFGIGSKLFPPNESGGSCLFKTSFVLKVV